jgi:hypothetical protein
MPETDTLERTGTRRLQVANLAPGDLGSGFARVSVGVMQALELQEGDIVEIVVGDVRAPLSVALGIFGKQFDDGLAVDVDDALGR